MKEKAPLLSDMSARQSLPSNLILLGYKASGKTYFGKRLAKQLCRPFLDTDDLIEKRYKETRGESLSCRQIARLLGEGFFRLLELEVLESLQSAQGAIIALGGGAVLDTKARLLVKELGTLIYLDVDKETLKNRVLRGEIPAFLDQKDPEGSFEKMYSERRPIYNHLSDIKIEVYGKTDQEVLDELKALADIQ